MEQNGQRPRAPGVHLPFRPPTVEEALPYTPLCSIAPFCPDVIAYPSAIPSTNTSIFTSASERQAADRSLEAWDNEIDTLGNTSERLQKTLTDLKRLLSSGDPTQFIFKEPQQIPSMSSSTAITSGTPSTPSTTRPRIGKFARTVLNHANIQYKSFKSPSASNGNMKNRQSSTPVSQTPPQPVRTQAASQNEVVAVRNNGVSLQQTAKAPPSSHTRVQKTPVIAQDLPPSTTTEQLMIKSEAPECTPSNSTKTTAMVVIPKSASASATPTKQPPTSTPQPITARAPVASPARTPQVVISPGPNWKSSQRSDWKQYPEFDASFQAGNMTLSQERFTDNNNITESQGRANVPDATVLEMEEFLEEVFELENTGDNFHVAANSIRLLTTISVDGTETQTMTTEALSKLDMLLLKVIKEKQFSGLSEEYLQRTQKLCEGYAASVSEVDLRVSDDWDEADTVEWETRVTDARDGLTAVKVLLRIMVAAGNNVKLCPEEILKIIVAAIKHSLDTLIVPIVESHTRASNNMSRVIHRAKTALVDILMRVGNNLKLLEQLFMNVTISEEVRSSVEDLAIRLVFVENATSEQNAPLGLQKYESLRKRAMDLVASIFERYPSQRDNITRYILSSLGSLPVAPSHARQYKMSGGGTIQVVSALFMRLVQSSATRSSRSSDDLNLESRPNPSAPTDGMSDSDADGESESDDDQRHHQRNNNQRSSNKPTLEALARPLISEADGVALSVVQHMVGRALEAGKGGESPYQKLYELFVEDLITVFVRDLHEWPAASILLNYVCRFSLTVYAKDSHAIASRTLALDIMGQLAGAIYDLQNIVRRDTRAMDASESQLSAKLNQLGENVINNEVGSHELYAFEGPYRLCIEYLNGMSTKDLRLQSARGYLLSTWASGVLTESAKEGAGKDFSPLGQKLRNALADPQWLAYNFDFPTVSMPQAHLASAIVALQSDFGTTLVLILNSVLKSCASNSSSIKSRGLKVLERLAEKDPSLLTQNPQVIPYIRKMALEDTSAQTRDHALQVLQTCFSQDRSSDKELCANLIYQARVDTSANPKRRCMRFLKDIYQRNDDVKLRSSIAGLFMNKILDLEDLIVKLAKESLEELWIAPFRAARDARLHVTFKSNVALIVSALQQDIWLVKPFSVWINGLLDEKSKFKVENLGVLKDLVANLFETFSEKNDKRQMSILKAIAVFAKANPRLLNRAQLTSLSPFLKSLQSNDDLELFFPALEIFNATMTTLITSPDDQLLPLLEGYLVESLSKLHGESLRQVGICFNLLSGYLKSAQSKCVNIPRSVALNLKNSNPTDAGRKVRKWLMLLGVFGYAHDYTPHLETFRKGFPGWKGTSVLSLFVDQICPRTATTFDKEIRVAAFEAIGWIGLKKPKELNREDVLSAMKDALEDFKGGLDQTVLEVLRDFFQSEEKRSETGAVIAVGKGAVQGVERMGTSLNASDNDGVITTLARTFLQPVKHIALSTTDDRAPVAVSILVSISRQGLVIPNECIPAFIALETSEKDNIAVPVFKEHESVHQKHESIVSKEYFKGVVQSYLYQMENFGNSRGAKFDKDKAAIPKLKYLFSIIKAASSKVRKDFFKVAASKLQFDFETFNSDGDEPQDLYFPQYVLENLASADYVQNIELITLTDNLLKIFSSTGTVVAELIERDVLSLKTAAMAVSSNAANAAIHEQVMTDVDRAQPVPNGEVIATTEVSIPAANSDIDAARLRHLTAASIVLTLVLETCNWLKKAYSLEKAKAKKDQHLKAPFRTNFVSAEKLCQQSEQIMSSLSSRESMIAQCQSFCQAVSLDSEHRIGSDDEEMADATNHPGGYATPEECDESGSEKSRTPGSGRGRKRKGSVPSSGMPTPKKRKGRLPGALGKKNSAKKAGRRSTSYDGADG